MIDGDVSNASRRIVKDFGISPSPLMSLDDHKAQYGDMEVHSTLVKLYGEDVFVGDAVGVMSDWSEEELTLTHINQAAFQSWAAWAVWCRAPNPDYYQGPAIPTIDIGLDYTDHDGANMVHGQALQNNEGLVTLSPKR